MMIFWIDFLPQLAPFWDPSWDPRAAQDGPKTSPRRSQDAIKTGHEPQEHQDRNLDHFWSQSPMGYPPPLASIFAVFGPLKFNFWCQVCARELGKFYIKFKDSKG